MKCGQPIYKRTIFTHPGKMGDLLCTLPVISSYYKITSERVFFITVEYCKPLIELLKLQECIEDAIIVQHEIIDFSMGGQPWKIEPMRHGYKYKHLYSLGFKHFPCPSVSEYASLRTGFPIDKNFVLNIPITKDDIEKNKGILYTDRQCYVDYYNAKLIDFSLPYLVNLKKIKASGRFIGAFSSLAAACALAKIPADIFIGDSSPHNKIKWREDIIRYHQGHYLGDTSKISKGD